MTDAVIDARELRRELGKGDSLASPAAIRPWCLPQEKWFDSLIQNGGFDADVDWTKGTGWSIGSGVATSATATGNLDNSGYKNPLIANVPIYVGFSVSGYTAGSVRPILAGGNANNGAFVSADGAHSEVITNSGNNLYGRFQPSGFAGNLDNVFAYESDGTDIIHRLPEGWEVYAVEVDGVGIREGASHDYTKHTDGFSWWVKPAVAPGVHTETRIWMVRALP